MSDAIVSERQGPAEFETILPNGPGAPVVIDGYRASPVKRIQRFLHANPTVVPFIVLMLGIVLGACVNWHRFTTGSNLSTILLQVTIIGILGIGQTLIILTAGVDLSIGIVMVLASIVMGRLCVAVGLPVYVGFPIGIAVGVIAYVIVLQM